MQRSATPKLKTYVALAALSFFLALVTGRAELVTVAAPFVAATLLGLVATPPAALDTSLHVSEHRCIEGDVVEATVEVATPEPWPEIEIALRIPAGFVLLEPDQPLVFRHDEAGSSTHAFKLRATRWGSYPLGRFGVRLRGPGRLSQFEQVFDRAIEVRVFPAYERISRTLPPIETQIYSGDYAARAAGDGIEFATVRPFLSGDNVRRVNWRVTSRRGELHVNLAQPERDSDVVLFLDTFTESHLQDWSTLDLTVRGATAITQFHLRHNDRVGLVSFGGMLRWLTASMGRTHAYRVADFLIDVNTTFSFAWKDIELLPHGTLPSGATVIAFSPLVDDRALKALVDINARGFSTAVINTLVEDDVSPSEGPEGSLAYRAWRLQRKVKRDRLRDAGIPVVDWSGHEGIHIPLAQLPRSVKRRTSRR